MALTKKQRASLFEMFDGKCAYCGCALPDRGWHADHVEPVLRRTEYSWTPQSGATIFRTGEIDNPNNERLDNYFPSCAPCNLFKATYSVEGFRSVVANQVTRARESSVNFRTAERFGLIEVKDKPVVFWFEKHLGAMQCEKKGE